jgi:hypothetical protein
LFEHDLFFRPAFARRSIRRKCKRLPGASRRRETGYHPWIKSAGKLFRDHAFGGERFSTVGLRESARLLAGGAQHDGLNRAVCGLFLSLQPQRSTAFLGSADIERLAVGESFALASIGGRTGAVG